MRNSLDTGIILFGHGARDPEWAQPFHSLREIMLRNKPGTPVELAFLELTAPNLEEAVERHALNGIKKIIVVPVFIAAGRHVKQDMPGMLQQLQQRYPNMQFEMTPVIGKSNAVLNAIADWVAGGCPTE